MRTFIGSRLYLMVDWTSASRSLNLTAGAFCRLVYCSRRLNWFMLRRQRLAAGSQQRSVGAGEAIGLVGQAELLVQRQTGAGNARQRVFLRRVHGDVILVGHGRIDELDGHVRSAAFQIPVAPSLVGEERGVAAAFFNVALAGAARSMRVVLVRRAELDIDLAAVGFPAGNARSEAVIGPRDAAIVLFLELVFFGVGCRIAAQPELLDEGLLFIVGLQPLERRPLFVADDPADFLVQPLACRANPALCADDPPPARFCFSVIGLATVSFFCLFLS